MKTGDETFVALILNMENGKCRLYGCGNDAVEGRPYCFNHTYQEEAVTRKIEQHYQFGILFRWRSFWVGWHYSPQNKRLCVNFIPCLTVWLCWPGGVRP